MITYTIKYLKNWPNTGDVIVTGRRNVENASQHFLALLAIDLIATEMPYRTHFESIEIKDGESIIYRKKA